MKSAYELAMERLDKTAPTRKADGGTKTGIADLESQCAAQDRRARAADQRRNPQAVNQRRPGGPGTVEKQLISDRKSIRAEFEEKKEKVRQGG